MTLVMKFGGTSVGSAQAIENTARLIARTKEAWGQVVVVASGMGSQPVKVTDLLLNGAYSAASGDGQTFQHQAEVMRQIHLQAIDGLLEPDGERQQILAENGRYIDRFEALCQAVHVLGELSPRALDTLADTLSPSRRRDRIPAGLQQRDLAHLLGMRHETVCRALGTLEHKGAVMREPDGLRIADRTILESE